jgi:hypothetical protein
VIVYPVHHLGAPAHAPGLEHRGMVILTPSLAIIQRHLTATRDGVFLCQQIVAKGLHRLTEKTHLRRVCGLINADCHEDTGSPKTSDVNAPQTRTAAETPNPVPNSSGFNEQPVSELTTRRSKFVVIGQTMAHARPAQKPENSTIKA